ncbi:MAG: murein biosynthesis integral membrane protein MurJ [Sphingomonadaceae bacterium]|nr:murein biosynthesis integral membrane protein MurJ [Sphingomonadaceae bacterium]
MNLYRATGTIGGLTLVSRVFGFIRDMLLARVLGAGLAADAYQLAFRLPNTFRRLFAEGAFSVAFVPMFSERLAGPGGEAEAERFSANVLSVFVWVLAIFTAILLVIMPGVVWLLASQFQEIPGKFELAVELSRLAFPYLALISLVSLQTGILNSMSRFGPGASAPILFNLTLISGIALGWWLRGDSGDDEIVVRALAVAISLSGLVQLIWLWFWLRRTGFRLKIGRPRFSPEVKELGVLILPATFGAGIYQLSQLIDTFFATSLPQGSLTLLSMGDRLNQMPLGIVGIALGTAILPALSRSIASNDEAGAARVQSNAVELAMLLTLPAAAALAICALPFVNAFFVGGRFTPENGVTTANIVVALVAGLPAYVMVKILTPGFFARKDTRTPVYTAATVLAFNVVLILLLIEPYGIVGLAAATAAASWLNTVLLYAILHHRGHFRLAPSLIGRIGRQIVATAAMSAMLYWLARALGDMFLGSWADRLIALVAVVAAGMFVYFTVGYLVGAVDREKLATLTKRRIAS